MDQFADLEHVTMSATFLLTIFTAGFLGSAHCAGMCGPLSHLVSKSFVQNMSYNSGRLLGYVTVGALFGIFGELLIDSEWKWLRYLGAALAIAFVGFSLASMFTGQHLSLFLPQGLRTSIFNFAQSKGKIAKGFYMGLLTTLLPCGWLMTFAGVAGASASAISGAAIMGTFWLSTLPIMTIVPLNAQKFLKPLQNRSPILVALLIAASSFFVIGIRFYSRHSCH